jgi:DNA topoisomerase IA
LKRSHFISGKPRPTKPIVPGIGQRWYFDKSEDGYADIAIKRGWDERRVEMHKQIREADRKFGNVIIAEDVDKEGYACWVIMRNPVIPHPRSRPHNIRKEWLLQAWRYGEEADIGEIGRNYSIDTRWAA